MSFTLAQALRRSVPIGAMVGVIVGPCFMATMGGDYRYALASGSAATVCTTLGVYFCLRTTRLARAIVYGYLWSIVPPAVFSACAVLGLPNPDPSSLHPVVDGIPLAAFGACYGATFGFIASFVIVPYIAILHPNRKLRAE